MLQAWFKQRRNVIPSKPIVFHPIKPLLLPLPRPTIRLFEVHHGIVIVTPLDKFLWNLVKQYQFPPYPAVNLKIEGTR
jgi:hypothetical protein